MQLSSFSHISGAMLQASPLGALLYYSDCQAATLSGMALKKRTPKYEWDRQLSICNKMITSCDAHGAPGKFLIELRKRVSGAIGAHDTMAR